MAKPQVPTSEVVVPLAVATAGLPSICAITGGAADGAVPLRLDRSWRNWKSPVVRMPMSSDIFTRWSRSKNIHIKARGLASLVLAVGIVLAFRSAALGVSVVAVAAVIHLIDLRAERTTHEVEPQLEREGSNLRISGVHQAFADAVAETVH